MTSIRSFLSLQISAPLLGWLVAVGGTPPRTSRHHQSFEVQDLRLGSKTKISLADHETQDQTSVFIKEYVSPARLSINRLARPNFGQVCLEKRHGRRTRIPSYAQA